MELDLLDELAGRARLVRDLGAPEGRAGLLRRLRSLEADALVELTWTLLGAAVGPRYERRLWLTRGRGRRGGDARGRGAGPPGDRWGPASAPRWQSSRRTRPGPPRRDRGRSRPHRARPRARPARAASSSRPPDGRPGGGPAERHGAAAIAGLVRRGLLRAEVRERPDGPSPAGPPAPAAPGRRAPSLTADQDAALRPVLDAIEADDATPILLDGVTGGGKTAIYVEAITASLAAGRAALLLVPEIALATPIVDRLRVELPVRIAVMHSGLGEGERADEWRRIRAGDVDLVVGTRTALLAPLADVGLVIVDEEHDAAYKSDRTPRFQARDAALALGTLAGAAVVLGSATPSVESMGHARTGRYRRAVLPVRPAGHRAAGHGRGPARRAGGRQPGAPLGRPGGRHRGAGHGRRRPGDPRHQPARDGVRRRLPRLRSRAGLPGL